MKDPTTSPIVVGGVDTHKELHVVAVVDAHDVVIGTESFSTTGPATGRWCGGCAPTAILPGSGWSAPAPTAPV